MGLFGNKKSMQDRQADAMQKAEKIVQGKGLTGKMTKAFMGSEFTNAMQGAMASANQAQQAAQLRAAGVPTETATVVQVQDTGQTINDNPNVVLLLDLGGRQVTITTLVSRLEIPRTGDNVLVVREPQTGTMLYAGLAPRA
ncbi:hypothetical protein EBN03_32690 [Nocardia stercoris]|uniref:Uncharacterized protein n=2 Tax=Nocardia stercoris TaxID=2483361 RepID=A0A3M2KT15_9NOCA|nr:hypothetical protein EBN03_32690 [Nocardia stercoris]